MSTVDKKVDNLCSHLVTVRAWLKQEQEEAEEQEEALCAAAAEAKKEAVAAAAESRRAHAEMERCEVAEDRACTAALAGMVTSYVYFERTEKSITETMEVKYNAVVCTTTFMSVTSGRIGMRG